MINWTFDKPTKPGKYLFLPYAESTEPEVISVTGKGDNLQGWNSFWKWYEPLYEFSDSSMWSREPVNAPCQTD